MLRMRARRTARETRSACIAGAGVAKDQLAAIIADESLALISSKSASTTVGTCAGLPHPGGAQMELIEKL